MNKFYHGFILLISLIIYFSPIYAKKNPTLDKKIGQMIMIGFDGTSIKKSDLISQDIINGRIGGVILFDYNLKTKSFDKNIKNLHQLKTLIQELNTYNHGLPLLIGIDYEGGAVNRLKPQYGFPKTVSASFLGKNKIQLTKQYSQTMAKTLAELGINLDFAPVLDLNVNPDCPVIGKIERSFSPDPQVVTQHISIMIKEFKDQGILCAMKHFPGHGSSETDSHESITDITNTWSSKELLPYQNLINNNQACDCVMIGHLINKRLDPTGYPATLSYKITSQLLRDQLGFKGVIITDDLQMKAITKQYSLKEIVKLSILAGNDILLFGNQLDYDPTIATKVIQLVHELIEEGVLTKERINQSYYRIVRLKRKLGIIPNYSMTQYNNEIKSLYQKTFSNKENLNKRIEFYSQYFLNKPYLLEPFGEEEKGLFDQSPLYRTDVFDCVTFVDTIIALAKSTNLDEFQKNLIKLRYKKAKVAYSKRTDWFTQIDWNSECHGNNFTRDITKNIVLPNGQSAAIDAHAIIDKPNWFKKRNLDAIKQLNVLPIKNREQLLLKLQNISKQFKPMPSDISYIPIKKLFNADGSPNMFLFNQIPDGVVIEIIRPNWQIKATYGTNLNVSHLGLGIRTSKELIFRHASSLKNKVLDIPLTTYLQNYLQSNSIKGIHIEKIL